MEVTKLKLERAAIRRGLSKLLNQSFVLDVVIDKEQRLIELDQKIEEVLIDVQDEKVWEDEFESREKYKELIVNLKAKCSVEDSSLEIKEIKRFKLPKLEFVKFSGDVKQWIKFWGQFEKIDMDKEIPEADKFLYLLQATEGRAKELIEVYPPSGDNYQKAISDLKRRFGREELLIDIYIRELIDLIVNKKDDLTTLYDKLRANINNLDSLGLTSDKYSCIVLPLVESSLPTQLIREWERAKGKLKTQPNGKLNYGSMESVTWSDHNYLEELLNFIQMEVDTEDKVKRTMMDKNEYMNLATGHHLLNEGKSSSCVFCNKNHNSQDCAQAQNMVSEEKKKILKEKRCCFYCLKKGHQAKFCKTFVKCIVCRKKHFTVMCPEIDQKINDKHESINERYKGNKKQVNQIENEKCFNGLSMIYPGKQILLQTLNVNIITQSQVQTVRCLIDTGSSYSYLLNDIAKRLKLENTGEHNMVHFLFGGQSQSLKHKKFKVLVGNTLNSYKCELEVLGQDSICKSIHRLNDSGIIALLKGKGIHLSDTGPGSEEIDMLLGADCIGKLLTGTIENLNNKLTAVYTKLGWTIMGEVPTKSSSVTSNSFFNSSVEDYWSLEAFGVTDVNSEYKYEDFDQEVIYNEERRYEIKLPWNERKGELENNKKLAEKRLETMTKKLKQSQKFEEYDQVLQTWESEGIIEETPINEDGHFLPHRPVFKASSQTTRIRPVFDASNRGKNGISLNDCVFKGDNLLECIPKILLRFRVGKYGVISDIKKAFLQICVAPDDQKYLKFLWWRDDKELKCYTHRRVVFGIKCSPFLLNSCIKHHLKANRDLYSETVEILENSFYVDNIVSSVETVKELNLFMKESNEIMNKGRFNLQGWSHTKLDTSHEQYNTCCDNTTEPVLGLMWDTDTLSCNLKPTAIKNILTKRQVLSVAQMIFDPVGFTCPVTITPKKILQECWKGKIDWDTDLPKELKTKFFEWHQSLKDLNKLKIERCCLLKGNNISHSIHVFVDGSKLAYAACIFVRSESDSKVKVSLLLAKTRITPIKDISIPRIELLAALLGAKLYGTIKDIQPFANFKVNFWTDSTVVLNWINDKRLWKPFITNRLKIILSHTNKENWRHIPGILNPADLLSRGCDTERLISEEWWQGPKWLYECENSWPQSSLEPAEEPIEEQSHCHVNILHQSSKMLEKLCELTSYSEIIRVIALTCRFINLKKVNNSESPSVEITGEEYKKAEIKLFRMLQKREFEVNCKFNGLDIIVDGNNLIRAKSKLTLMNEDENFLYPILLPHGEITKKLIREEHLKNKHAGVKTLMVLLRQNYWITKCRKTVKEVVKIVLNAKELIQGK